MTPDYFTIAARDCDYLLTIGYRRGLDRASYQLERAYLDRREAAYDRQDAAELRWAAERDLAAVNKAWAEMDAREAAVSRVRIGSVVTFLAAAVLFVATLMVSH